MGRWEYRFPRQRGIQPAWYCHSRPTRGPGRGRMVLRFCYPVDRDAKRPYRRSRCVRTGEDRQVSIRSRTTKTHRQPLSRLSAAVVASTVGFIPALKGGAFSLHFRNRTANRTATANRTVADKTESTAPQQHRPVPHCIAPPYTAQHRPAPHCTALTRPTLHSIDPPHTAQHRPAPHCTASTRPTLHCPALHRDCGPRPPQPTALLGRFAPCATRPSRGGRVAVDDAPARADVELSTTF